MNSKSNKHHESNNDLKKIFIKVLIAVLIICNIYSIFQCNNLSEKKSYYENLSNEQSLMLYNTKLEFIDFVETRKQENVYYGLKQSNELDKESMEEIQNKFRIVHYTMDPMNGSKVIKADFSDLAISCTTYNRVLPEQKRVFIDAEIINKNCDDKIRK